MELVEEIVRRRKPRGGYPWVSSRDVSGGLSLVVGHAGGRDECRQK